MDRNLIVAYDLVETGVQGWEYAFVGVAVFILGYVVRRYPQVWRFTTWGAPDRAGLRGFLSMCWMIGGLLGSGVALMVAFGQYSKLEAWYLSKDYTVTEGQIVEMHTTMVKGRPKDVFSIGTLSFIYPVDSSFYGIRQRHEEGGPIREGAHARIYHHGNDILRLEIEPRATE
ncbi:hypothetical protein [Kordiimonas lacus]|uniref:Uncharacterized protein n=1 Tax=Kordiimonas lacus TaxID=637679 RepID=A0A1G7BIL4_9PROT|nr:hypothetical protein [Kordiimonas lacus]SDE26125.1 hypothetical protein SAMN04488071_2506 [Kordiimonas lacus]